MTNLYFVRHAKIQYTHDDHSRQLSEEGTQSVPLVTKVFDDIHIDAIVSSPYVRALKTIEGIADNKNLEIHCFDDLRERKVAHTYIDDFQTFTMNQWNDFDFRLDGGESLREVQNRGVKAIERVIDTYEGQSVIVGTHGTFMAVQLNYFDPNIDFNFWRQLKMPDIYKATFDGYEMIKLENIHL